MDAAKRLADKHNLQDLVPLNALSESRFAEIAQKIVVEEVKKGKYLFRKGDRDNQSIFLLDGKIILIDGHRKVIGEVEAGTDISRYPIASQQPRSLSVRAVTKVVIARIDSGLLDVFLTWDQTSGSEATEIKSEDNEDWMSRMLQSEAFIKIPPAMIQRLLIKMESCPVQKGDAVIRQGDPGDYFYTIHKGTCAVTRIQEDGEEITLAELSDGDCFGEESLVSDTRRNASVTMTSDGLLMRLAKKDFVELLQKPLVRHVGYEEAVRMVEEGAVWVDVRSPGEYENTAFEDSVNIPLAELRGEMPELVYNAKYIMCCDTGRRSASAAFMLSHKGFEVFVLDGGINGLPPETADDDAVHTHDDAVAGDQSVDEAEIIDLKAKQDAATGVQVDAMEPASTGQDGVVAEQSAELESLRAEIVSLQSEKQAVEEQAGSTIAEQQEHSEQLQAALDTAESEKHDILAQLEALRESQAESRQQLDQSAEEVDLARREAAELKQALESLQAEKRELEDSQSATQAADEALQRQQQEWDGERAALQDELATLRDSVAELQGQLDRSREEAASEQARLEEEFGSRSDKAMKQVEELEVVHEELRQQREQVQEELQRALAERDEIRQKLESDMQQGGALQQEVENLKDRLSALTDEKDAEISGLNTQLQAEQLRAAEAAQQLEAGMAGNEELRARLAQQEETAAQLRNEVESQAQQLEAARLELQQAVERARSVELESEETLSKAWNDLNRKNDTENELQGQITRLRKKLEQTTTDLQQVREEAREAATQARDILHAERKERADERAQMAARQRELKEQMLAVAGQHEELQSSQEGALAKAESAARNDERARLQEVLDTHAQTEDQLAAMRQELAQAREETERAISEERQRHVADLDFARAQKSELDAVVTEQESRLQEVTAERDAAVSERQSIREQLNSLRAEVEVARGVINANGDGEVEDPVKLRAELEEAKRNLDIAIRVRSEAESARDSALADRDAMQQQLEDAGVDAMPLTIPSLDEQDVTAPAEVSSADAADNRLADAAANSGAQLDDTVATVPGGARIGAWLGKAIGLGVVVLALLASWFLLENHESLFSDPGTVTVGNAAPLSGDSDSVAPVTVTPADTSAATAVSRSPAEAVKPEQPAEMPVVKTRTPGPEKPAVAAEVRQQPEPDKAPVPETPPLAAGRSFSDALRNGGRGPVVVELPASSYMMGSKGASPNFSERPRHEITLQAFAIGKHEVTFAEYDRFARATGRRLPYDEGWGRGKRPVINVSWKDATAYAAWLSKQTGHTYRLPTEAQWEYATRAGTTTPYWWPKSSKEIPANCFDCGSQWDGKTSAAVGSFSPNAFGLHDTAGNVQEWTQDCYHKSYKGAPSDGSAWQSAGCSQRVVRGGAYTSPLRSLRSARRAHFDQESRMDNIGFRVVRIK